MAEVQCVRCQVSACKTESIEETPAFCPRRNAAEALAQAEEIRTTDAEVKRYVAGARVVETEGYRQWPRVRELIEYSKRMGFGKLGIAFCVGLREETTILADILESHGFDVSSVACTVEGGCNPVGQALTLAHVGTDLNVIMGLCMGHDVLFTKFSKAPVTTLVVKDRVTCHNPVGPLVCRYWRKDLLKQDT